MRPHRQHPPRLQRWALASLALLALGPWPGPGARAAPFTPQRDDEVVERLPQRLDAGWRSRQAAVARGAQDLPQALQTAREAIANSRRLGDPRELGLAQAALAPWWALAAPPPSVRLLRATVRQSQHDFEGALADLDALVRDAAGSPPSLRAQALLNRATVRQVTGRLAEAQADCTLLSGAAFSALGAPLAIAARACLAELRSLQGEPDEAERLLADLARTAPRDGWLALVRAELAERRGDARVAQAGYQVALQDGDEVYARAAHADWLLRQGRAAEVLQALPAAAAQADALALRRAIALRHTRDPAAGAAAAALQARFDEARLRGDATHAREEARFLLDVVAPGQRPGSAEARASLAAALRMAQANWRRQKEPADALLLARAALAADDGAGLAGLRGFVQRTGWKDVRLAAVDRSLQP